jgi:hypothetical protein
MFHRRGFHPRRGISENEPTGNPAVGISLTYIEYGALRAKVSKIKGDPAELSIRAENRLSSFEKTLELFNPYLV